MRAEGGPPSLLPGTTREHRAAAETEKLHTPRGTWGIPKIYFNEAKSTPKDHLSHAPGSRGRGDLPRHLALQHRWQSHSCKPSDKGCAASSMHMALTGQGRQTDTFLPSACICWTLFSFTEHLGPPCSPLPTPTPN